MSKRPTKRQKDRFSRIVELGCLVPGCGGEANIHHCRHACGMGQRKHDHVAPLCKYHHQDGPFARHKDPAKFVEFIGTDEDLHEKTCLMLGEG